MRLLYAIAISWSFFGMALAEPDDTSLFLMNDQATMMDVGLLNVRLLFSQTAETEDVNVNYSWRDDEFLIEDIVLSVDDQQDELSFGIMGSTQDLEEVCFNRIMNIRLVAGLDAGEGNQSILGFLFTHTGFKRPSEPINLVSDLNEKFKIVIMVFAANGSLASTTDRISSLKCSAPLLGYGFDVERIIAE